MCLTHVCMCVYAYVCVCVSPMLSGSSSSWFWDSSRSVSDTRPLISAGSFSRRFLDTSKHTSLRRFPSSCTQTQHTVSLQLTHNTQKDPTLIQQTHEHGEITHPCKHTSAERLAHKSGGTLTGGREDRLLRSSHSSRRLGRAPIVSG